LDEVIMAQGHRPSNFFVVFDARSGALLRSFNASGNVLLSPHGLHTAVDGASIWATDANHAVYRLGAADGRVLDTLGVPGAPGAQLQPIHFDLPADVAVTRGGDLIVADGDGGVINARVVFLQADGRGGFATRWAAGTNGTGPGQFAQFVHALAYQARTDTLWIADEHNARLQALDGQTGAVRGTWGAECFGGAGAEPWGLRVDEERGLLLLTDGALGRFAVLNLTDAGEGSGSAPLGACGPSTMLQALDIDRSLVPHELAVDRATGDVYVACVGGKGALLKYSLV